MHIARIGADKSLDGKHPDVAVRRGNNGSEIRAKCSYSQQKIIVFIHTQFAEGKEADCSLSAVRDISSPHQEWRGIDLMLKAAKQILLH